ncbi:hypothetical protein Ssi03_77140 [Sphaerisporangium siamense]|uniref:Uncharacterized protein n=1 Tax=Sphaerisporangium siamense TaxID=795645 RepID=A0A7W7D8J0_9ACTN|nr:hypothetical protein [Sphaerisporangium siamense]MBB4702268.1 hypothetical protein [Sphaerisporangium siamense]GII89724.1 hypothetical protein Ssi03_77140 [Sphaerisporangium siamense]
MHQHIPLIGVIAILTTAAYAVRRTSITAPKLLVGVVVALAVLLGAVPPVLDSLGI